MERYQTHRRSIDSIPYTCDTINSMFWRLCSEIDNLAIAILWREWHDGTATVARASRGTKAQHVASATAKSLSIGWALPHLPCLAPVAVSLHPILLGRVHTEA